MKDCEEQETATSKGNVDVVHHEKPLAPTSFLPYPTDLQDDIGGHDVHSMIVQMGFEKDDVCWKRFNEHVC